MNSKPTYAELKKKVLELEAETANHKQVEASLRKSNETVNSILTASPIGIGLVENRIIQQINEAMIKMFGFDTEEDYLGKSARIIYPSEEEFQNVGDLIYQSLKAGKGAQLDATFKRKDGTTFFGHLKVNTLYPPDPMQRATFTISDISWRKRAEAELLQREKLQAAIEMAGAVCHGMNQPLQAALVELAELSRLQIMDTPSMQTKIDRIKKQFYSMGEMTQKLMRITKYETRDYVAGEKIIDIDKAAGLRD